MSKDEFAKKYDEIYIYKEMQGKKVTRADILDGAKKCVCEDRESQYGSPEDSFGLIAELWEPIIRERCVSPGADVCVTGDTVALLMNQLKVARIASGRFKADSYIDACGYLACAGEIAGRGESK